MKLKESGKFDVKTQTEAKLSISEQRNDNIQEVRTFFSALDKAVHYS